MKFKSILTATLLVSIFSACNKQAKKSNGETQHEPSDTVKTEMPSCPVDTFSSPDLTLNELKQKVKQCDYSYYMATVKDTTYTIETQLKEQNYTLTFTEKGLLKSNRLFKFTYDEKDNLVKGENLSNKEMKIVVDRDKQGRIKTITSKDKKYGMESDQAYKVNYTWNKQGEVEKEVFSGWEWKSASTYTYNEEGLRTMVRTKDNPGYEEEITSKITYQYTAFDNKGNWIARNVKTVTTTSTLDMETDQLTNSTTQTTYTIEKRNISYYE